MSPTKVSLDVLIETLLQESSRTLQETLTLQWEWEHFLKLNDMLSQVKEKEAARDSADALQYAKLQSDEKRRKGKIQPFLDWLQINEIDTSKITIEPLGNMGLGVFTKVLIKTEEMVFVIPEKAMMTTANARNSKLKILLEKDPVIRSMPNVLMSLFLLYEKYVSGNASFWLPYIDILPASYDTVAYFSVEEMALLKQTPNGFREGLKMYRNIVRQYAYFHNVFRKSTDSGSRALRTIFTYNRYAWAASTAMTRQNSLSRPGDAPDDLCLIPLWDMCNHEETGILSNAYHAEEKFLACYAGHDYEPKTEFKIFYGERTSIDYFTHGGFVPECCSADLYTLELGIGRDDLNYARKKVILGYMKLNSQESFTVTPERLGTSRGLFVFVRLIQADKAFLERIEANTQDLTYLTEASEEVWQFLTIRFTILKKAAETSRENLQKALPKSKRGKLPNKLQMIFQLVKNELKLLELLAHCAKDHLTQAQKAKKDEVLGLTNKADAENNLSDVE